MMNGIDISHYQKGIDLGRVACDFVIAKATEGVNFTDPYFETFMKKAESLDKCLGMYHFARPDRNAAKAEAEFFYSKTVKWYGKAIPILDWETGKLDNVAWVKEWLDTVYSLTGIKPMIYTSTFVVNNYDWSSVAAADYGLWIAKWKDKKTDYNYDMSNAGAKPKVSHWKFWALWQWTSCGRLDGYGGDLDCNVFNGDRKAWALYAGAKEERTYTIKEGDTLSFLAKRFETTVDDIVAKNRLITPGDVIRI
jgi:lysozyme